MLINPGLYPDSTWPLAVQFHRRNGDPVDMSGADPVARFYLQAGSAPLFVCDNDLTPGVGVGTIDLTQAGLTGVGDTGGIVGMILSVTQRSVLFAGGTRYLWTLNNRTVSDGEQYIANGTIITAPAGGLVSLLSVENSFDNSSGAPTVIAVDFATQFAVVQDVIDTNPAREYTNTRTTGRSERLKFGPLTPYDFKATPDHDAVQDMIDAAASVGGAYRRPECFIPPMDIRVGNLTVPDVQGGTALTRGNLRINGAGKQNTKIICESPTGGVVTISSGKVELGYMTITSDNVARGCVLGNGGARGPTSIIGTGSGVVIDSGQYPAPSTIADIILRGLQIDYQPQHGILVLGMELGLLENNVVNYAGGDSLHMDNSNPGGSILGISNTIINQRSFMPRGRHITEINGVNTIYINPQCLGGESYAGGVNDGYGFFCSSTQPKIFNADMEGDFIAGLMTTNLYGAWFSGPGARILGGIIHGYRTAGFKFTGDSQSIELLQFSNTSEASQYSMATAIDCTTATNFKADIPLIGTGVTQPFTPAFPVLANSYRHNGEQIRQIISGSGQIPTQISRASGGTDKVKTAVAQNAVLKLMGSQGYDGAAYRAAANEYVTTIAATPSSSDMQARWQVDVSDAGSVTPTQGLSYDHTAGLRIKATPVIGANRHLYLPAYTVATLPSAALPVALIYVSDGAGNKHLASSDSVNWRWADGSVVS